MYQPHTNIDLIKIHVYAEVHNDLCFTVQDFAFYLEDCLTDQLHTWGRVNGSVWHKQWPNKLYVIDSRIWALDTDMGYWSDITSLTYGEFQKSLMGLTDENYLS